MLEIHNYDPYQYAGSNPTVHDWGSEAGKKTLATWADEIEAYSTKTGLPIYYGECPTEPEHSWIAQ